MPVSDRHLIWIDLEMTGLDLSRERIIEIATLITDSELNELAVGPELAVRQQEALLLGMDDWNMRTHKESGLYQRVQKSEVTEQLAEQKTLHFLRDWVPPNSSPMCGNSICTDRQFLAKYMPELHDFFHYRHIDVSTLKELAQRWAPAIKEGFRKESRHRALEDIRDSIAELRHYRAFMGELSGLS